MASQSSAAAVDGGDNFVAQVSCELHGEVLLEYYIATILHTITLAYLSVQEQWGRTVEFAPPNKATKTL